MIPSIKLSFIGWNISGTSAGTRIFNDVCAIQYRNLSIHKINFIAVLQSEPVFILVLE